MQLTLLPLPGNSSSGVIEHRKWQLEKRCMTDGHQVQRFRPNLVDFVLETPPFCSLPYKYCVESILTGG